MNHLPNILRSLAAMVAIIATVVLTPACSGPDEPVKPAVTTGARQVGFTLTVSDAPSSPSVSRATPTDGTYDPGSGYENHIDIDNSDFRFYFFSTDDKYIGDIDVTSVVPLSSAPGSKQYNVMGSLPAEMAVLTDFKVCVLANWASYPELAYGDNLSRLWSDGDAIYMMGDGTLSATSLVPLYGIKEFSGVTFTPDVLTDLDVIHMLRAYAKVEVNLDKTVFQVKTVSLTRVNDRGYKAPKDVNEQGKYVHDAYELDYVNTPNIPAGSQVLTEVPMHLVSGDNSETPGERKFMIYVPEYDNTSSSATASRIHLTYADGDINEAYVDFKYYKTTGSHQAGEKFDVLRNYWYRFNLSQGPVDLTVYVDVQPYANVVLKPDFGLERDEEGYIIVRNHKGEVIRYIRTDGAILELGDIYMPFYGVIKAVFDSKRRALLGYLDGGRRVYWNYDGDDDATANVTSWEIYSDENDEEIDIHLDEDYIRIPSAGSGIEAFTQSFFDDKGRVVRRYLYPSNEAFENRTFEGEGAIKLVDYTGNLYGAKVITYYDKTGKAYSTVTVTVGADGKETETYK